MTKTPPPRADPTAESGTDKERLAAAFGVWRETLMSVKKSVDEATAAVGLLRATVLEMAPLWRSLGELEKGLGEIDWGEAVGDVAADLEESPSKVTRLQPQTPAVAEESAAPGPEEPNREQVADARHTSSERPLPRLDVPASNDGAPHSYSVTVEEVGSRVKLVPLHQALGRVKGVRELSLKSYTNGVAVVSVDCAIELEASALEEAIAAATDKPCRVVSGDGPSFLARVGDNPALEGQRQERGGR